MELEQILQEITRISQGIKDYATDTVWCSDIETACDALDYLIEEAKEI